MFSERGLEAGLAQQSTSDLLQALMIVLLMLPGMYPRGDCSYGCLAGYQCLLRYTLVGLSIPISSAHLILRDQKKKTQ